jgi:DNA replication factor GINS
MDLEKLRQIILDTKNSGKLTEIPPQLYEDSQRYLQKLKKDYYAIGDPLDNHAGGILIEEISSVRDSIAEIFNIRTAKIMGIAIRQMEGQYSTREDTRKMLPAEREMFEQVVSAMERCRQELISPEGHTPSEHLLLERDAQEECAPECTPASGAGPSVRPVAALARILMDMDSFMGVDGRVYHLMKGDIVTMPEKNAEVLCERNIALNIRLNK